MKKILFFIPTLMHGGAEKVLVNLVNNMDQAKYEITVQTIFDVGVHKDSLKDGIKYKTIFPRLFRGSTTMFKFFSPEFLYKRLVKDEYDIAVSYLEGATTRILTGCPFKKTKLVSWIHIELNNPKMASVGFRNLKECQTRYKRYHKVVCVSEKVRDVFVDSIGKINQDKVKVLYNTNETDDILEKCKEPIKDLNLNPNVLNICSVAKIMKTKGYDRLARVHKRLLKEGFKEHIYILGIGEEQKELEKYLKENQLTDTFTFLGYKDNPYQYVAKCDLYVCSSRREGFSTAVTESLIVGTPVVSTACSGAVEMLGSHNEYGIVVENSTKGIYKGIKQMLIDPELLSSYKEKAKERGKYFDKRNTVMAVERMLDSLLNENRGES